MYFMHLYGGITIDLPGWSREDWSYILEDKMPHINKIVSWGPELQQFE